MALGASLIAGCGQPSLKLDDQLRYLEVKIAFQQKPELIAKQEFWLAVSGGGFSARSFSADHDTAIQICQQQTTFKETAENFAMRYPMARLHLKLKADVCSISKTDSGITTVLATDGTTLLLLRLVG